MTERKWWPAEYADESMPPGRSRPDGFIIMLSEGNFELGYSSADEDGCTESDQSLNRKLELGDIVEFISCDLEGAADVRFSPDGTHIALEPVPPSFTSCWIPYDSDTLADALDGVAEIFCEAISEPETATVQFLTWSEPIPFKFVHSAAGYAFEQVSAAEARQ